MTQRASKMDGTEAGTRPRLLLHIGMHKTGTTSIQKFATGHRDALRELGLYYPQLKSRVGPSNPGHHHFAHALSDEKSPSVGFDAAMDFIEDVRNTAGADTVLLSAEPFCRHVLGLKETGDYWTAKRQYIEAVKQAISGFDVQIVVVFRRLDSFIQSLYKESILKSNYKKDINRFIAERANTFEYIRQIEAWEDAFGADKVIVGIYDSQLRGRDTVDAFFALLGFDTGAIGGKAGGEANVSLPSTVVELKRQLNKKNLVGRQSLKLREMLQVLFEERSFIDLVAQAFETERVRFDDSGALRAQMDGLVERLRDPASGRAEMAGWKNTLEQGRIRDREKSAALVDTLLLSAQAHFRIASDIHRRYAKEHELRGNSGQAVKSLDRALEFAPKNAGLYKSLLEKLPRRAKGERETVLRSASKDLAPSAYRNLVRAVKGK